MKARGLLGVVAAMLICAHASAAALSGFDPANWSSLREAHAGRPWIVHFWGMSCGPCREELPAWGHFMRTHGAAAMTFVEVEPAAAADVKSALARAGLRGGDQRIMVVAFDAQARFPIDRHWGGELPLTLLIAANGQPSALIGEVDFALIDAWLVKQKIPGAASGKHPVP